MTAPRPTEESYDREVDLRMWRRLFRYALHYRRDMALLAITGVLTAAADVAMPLVTRSIIDSVHEYGAAVNLWPYALAYGALAVIIAVCVFAFINYGGKIRTHVSHDIRRDAFENLQSLSFSFFDHRPVGWLMARMTSDCERLSNIFAWGVLDLFWGSTMMLGIASVMLFVNWKLALVVLVVVPLLVAVSAFFKKRILTTARVVRGGDQ